MNKNMNNLTKKNSTQKISSKRKRKSEYEQDNDNVKRICPRKRSSIQISYVKIRDIKSKLDFISDWSDNKTFSDWMSRGYFDNKKRKCHVKTQLTLRDLLFINYCSNIPFRFKRCGNSCNIFLTRFLCEFNYDTKKLICPDCAKHENITPRTSNQTVFKELLVQNFGDEKRKCFCCSRFKITAENFHKGHVVSHKNNGSSNFDNFRPICQDCNQDMKDTHMLKFMFIKKYKNCGLLFNQLYPTKRYLNVNKKIEIIETLQ